MSGFKFMGYSTEDIIDAELVLLSFDKMNSVNGVKRESQTGEQTIYRNVPNDYGTISSPLTFSYYLMKKPYIIGELPYDADNEEGYDICFTEEEQVKIESWLTSPKFNSNVDIFDCAGEYVCTYCGKFINTEWLIGPTGYMALRFEFLNESAYPKIVVKEKITLNNEAIEYHLNCDTNEWNEYTYPTLYYKQNNTYDSTEGDSQMPTEPTFILKNMSDGGKQLSLIANKGMEYIVNCRKCIVKNINLKNGSESIVTFRDLGWNKLSNIYFPRFVYGENILEITGDGELVIEYEKVYKKVGGWL